MLYTLIGDGVLYLFNNTWENRQRWPCIAPIGCYLCFLSFWSIFLHSWFLLQHRQLRRNAFKGILKLYKCSYRKQPGVQTAFIYLFFLWATVLNRVIMTDNWREERYFIFPWKKEKVKLFVFQESLFFFFFCFKLIFGNTPLPLGNCVLAWVKCINCDGVQVAWERRCGFKVSGFPGVKLCAQNANSGYSRFQGIIFCGEEVCAATGSVKYHLPW